MAVAELVAARLDGLTTIKGDPEALRAAGRVWAAAAEAVEAAIGAHAAAAGLAGAGWAGDAARVYAGAVAGLDPSTAAAALRTAAGALHAYAAELDAAKSVAARALDAGLEAGDEAARLEGAIGTGTAEDFGWSAAMPGVAPLLEAATAARLQGEAAAEQAAAATVRAAGAFDHVASLATGAAATTAATPAFPAPGGGLLGWLAEQATALGRGVWAGISEPVTQLVQLTIGEDRSEAWRALRASYEDGAIHPDQYAARLAGLGDLEEHGVAYWLGGLLPGVAGTLLGGAGAVARGARSLGGGTDDLAGLRDLGRLIDGKQRHGGPARLAEEKERWVLDSPSDPMEGARAFSSKRDAAAWGEQHWGEVARSLPTEVREVVEYYTGSGYRTINGQLRGSHDWPWVAEKIALLDDAISRRAVPEDVIVWRGADGGAFAGHEIPDLTGQTFTEDGYLSTALGDTEYGTKPVLMKLRVPEGTPALYVDPISSFPGERELLLGRGMRYQVHSVSKMKDGRWLVEAEILAAAG